MTEISKVFLRRKNESHKPRLQLEWTGRQLRRSTMKHERVPQNTREDSSHSSPHSCLQNLMRRWWYSVFFGTNQINTLIVWQTHSVLICAHLAFCNWGMAPWAGWPAGIGRYWLCQRGHCGPVDIILRVNQYIVVCIREDLEGNSLTLSP